MIEVNIPQDIREFEPTLIGSLTTRKTICGTALVAGTLGMYYIERAAGISDPFQFPVFMLAAIPPFLIGWLKPYGMHFEKFIVKAFTDNFLAPAHRLYKIENIWDTLDEDIEKQERRQERKEKKKKDKVKETPRNKLPMELRPYR